MLVALIVLARTEDVELECDGAKDGSQEQPGDPDRRADYGTFAAVVLEVPVRKCEILRWGCEIA